VDECRDIAAVKAAPRDRVSDVRASQRLTDSASCLVATGAGPDRRARSLLARQTGHVGAKPILEINTRHPWSKLLPMQSSPRAMGMWRILRSCCSTRRRSSTGGTG